MKNKYNILKAEYYPTSTLAGLKGKPIHLTDKNIMLLNEYRKKGLFEKLIIVDYEHAGLLLPKKGGPTITVIPVKYII